MRALARLMLRGLVVALLLVVGERAVMSPTKTATVAPQDASLVQTSRVRFDGARRRRPRSTTTTAAPGPTTAATSAPTTAAPPVTTAATTATTTAPPVTTARPTTTTGAATTSTTARPTTTTAKATTTTAAATTTVAPGARFATLAPGTALPSGAACATRVRSAPEVRAVNATFNATAGTQANTVYPRVDGKYTGTTDEILQWVACKWGIDEDVVRAQIAVESWWDQRAVGDNGESFGLGQVRQPYHQSAFVDDNAKLSSAYNVDYTYGFFRSCFEGEMTWLNTVEHTGTYAAGDMWGCLGVWFSGRWHTAPAESYITTVKSYLSQRIWTTPSF